MANSAFSVNPPFLDRVAITDFHYIETTDPDDSFSVGGNSVATGSNLAVGTGITIDTPSTDNIVAGLGHAVTGDYNAVFSTGTTVTGDSNVVSSPGSTVSGDDNYVFGDGNTVTGSNNFLFASGVTLTASGQVRFGYPVTLNGAPTVDLHAATKKYVDDGLALKLGTTLAATGVVNGSNTAFTFTQQPTFIVSDGVMLRPTNYDSSVNWSWSGSTATMTTPPFSSIIGIA